MPVAPGVQDYLQGRELCGGASLYRHHWKGSIPTAIELSEFRLDRSADFSPLPAVLGAPERGGLKSALLDSMLGVNAPATASNLHAGFLAEITLRLAAVGRHSTSTKPFAARSASISATE